MGTPDRDVASCSKTTRRGRRSTKRDRSVSESSDRTRSDRDRRRSATRSASSGEETDPPKGLQARCAKYYEDESMETGSDCDTPEKPSYKKALKSPRTPKSRSLGHRYDDEARLQFEVPNPVVQSTPRKKSKAGRVLTIKSSKKKTGKAGKSVSEDASRLLQKMGFDGAAAKKFGDLMYAEKTEKRSKKPKSSLKKSPEPVVESDSTVTSLSSSEADVESSEAESEAEPEKLTVSFEPAQRKRQENNTIARNPSFVGTKLDVEQSYVKFPNPANLKKREYRDDVLKMALTIAHTHMVNAPENCAATNVTRARDLLTDATVMFWDKTATEEELRFRYPRFAESPPQAQPFRPKLKGKYKSLNQSISLSVCAKPFKMSAGEVAQTIQDLVTFSRAKPEEVVKSLNRLFAQKSKTRISYRVKNTG